MYLSVLRDIGSDKLKNVIEKSGSPKKDKLKKNIDVITKYISGIEFNVNEKLTPKQIEEYVYGKKAVEYATKLKNNPYSFLTTKPSEFRPIAD